MNPKELKEAILERWRRQGYRSAMELARAEFERYSLTGTGAAVVIITDVMIAAEDEGMTHGD